MALLLSRVRSSTDLIPLIDLATSIAKALHRPNPKDTKFKKSQRGQVTRKWREKIDEAVVTGKVRIIDPVSFVHVDLKSGDPKTAWVGDGVVARADVMAWLQSSGYGHVAKRWTDAHALASAPHAGNADVGSRKSLKQDECTGSPTSIETQGKELQSVGKRRRNLLDPAIDKAIKRAGGFDLASVWNHLTELALDGEHPFKGSNEDGRLGYSDAHNGLAWFQKDALRERLRRRRNVR